MEWLKPVIFSIIIVSCFLTTLFRTHNKQYRNNVYKLDNMTATKLNSDEDFGKTLQGIFICNKSTENVASNGYKSRKL